MLPTTDILLVLPTTDILLVLPTIDILLRDKATRVHTYIVLVLYCLENNLISPRTNITYIIWMFRFRLKHVMLV